MLPELCGISPFFHIEKAKFLAWAFFSPVLKNCEQYQSRLQVPHVQNAWAYDAWFGVEAGVQRE